MPLLNELVNHFRGEAQRLADTSVRGRSRRRPAVSGGDRRQARPGAQQAFALAEHEA